MERWEKDIIRDLARKKLEISQLPEMIERIKLWTDHNDFKSNIPMIHFETNTVNEEGFQIKCMCESQEARSIEWQLRHSIVNYIMVGDDRVVTDDYVCGFSSSIEPFSMPVKKTLSDGVGFHIEPQIKDLNDIELKKSLMSFDVDSAKKAKDIAEDVLGDILKVRIGMGGLYVCLTNDIIHRMGMENMFMAMYDTSDKFHYMMDSLSNDYVEYIKGLETRGMLCTNSGNDWVCQGSFGFTNDLPKDKVGVKSTDCWGFMDSQETVGISPEMFNEFFFPYYKKIADMYGLLSYGCCEPVNSFWEKSISKFENLRKISISPWCDEEYMGEQLRDKKIIYQRKPSPNFVGVGSSFDEEGFRKHIRKTLNAAQGCNLEITFRDVYTLNGDIQRPRRAVQIVREEIENNWK